MSTSPGDTILTRLNEVLSRLDGLERAVNIQGLETKASLAELRGTLGEFRGSIAELRVDVAAVRQDVLNLGQDMRNLWVKHMSHEHPPEEGQL